MNSVSGLFSNKTELDHSSSSSVVATLQHEGYEGWTVTIPKLPKNDSPNQGGIISGLSTLNHTAKKTSHIYLSEIKGDLFVEGNLYIHECRINGNITATGSVFMWNNKRDTASEVKGRDITVYDLNLFKCCATEGDIEHRIPENVTKINYININCKSLEANQPITLKNSNITNNVVVTGNGSTFNMDEQSRVGGDIIVSN